MPALLQPLSAETLAHKPVVHEAAPPVHVEAAADHTLPLTPHRAGAVLGGHSLVTTTATIADHEIQQRYASETTAIADHQIAIAAGKTPAGPPKPLDAGADKDYQQLVTKDAHNKAKLAEDAALLLFEHQGNEKYQEQIVADSTKSGVYAQTIDQTQSRRYAGGGTFQFGVEKATVDAIAAGAVKGEDIIHAAAADTTNAPSQAAANVVALQATQHVNDARHAYEDKVADKAKLDQRLAAELAKVGAGLSDDQRKQFISSFQKEHGYTQLQGEIDSAAATLDTTLQKNAPTLEAVLKTGGPKLDMPEKISGKDVTDATVDAMKDLAGSDKAGDSLKMAGSILKDPTLSKAMLAADNGEFKNAMNAVAEQAIPRVGAQLLAAADKKRLQNAGKGAPGERPESETEDVFNQLKEQLEPFEAAHDVFGSSHKLVEAFNTVKDASEGKFDALKTLVEGWDKEAPTGLEKGFAALDVAFGAHSFSNAKDFTDVTKAIAATGEGVNTIDEALEGLKFGAKLGGDIGRFAPGIGVVASLAAAAADFSAAKHGDIGAGISVAGDLLSALGSGLEATPAAPIGAIIDLGGMLVSGIGTGISALFGGGEQSPSDEATNILKNDLHLSSGLASGLGHADAGTMATLSRGGSTQAQIDDIATNYGDVLSDTNVFHEMQVIQAGFGIQSKNTDPMLNLIATDVQNASGNGQSKADDFRLFEHVFFEQYQEATGRAARDAGGDATTGKRLQAEYVAEALEQGPLANLDTLKS